MRSLRLCPLLFSSLCLFGGVTDQSLGLANPEPDEKASATFAMGSPTDPDRFSHLPQLLLDDAGHVIHAPMRWDRSDWVTLGAGAAAVLGTGLLLDHSVERYVATHANSSWDRMAKASETLGGPASVLIAGGIYIAGVAFKDPEVRATGIDIMATMGIAQLLIVLPLKGLVGRDRPDQGTGTHTFNPLHGGQSFPSSHTTQAFALAAVIAEHADRPWVSVVSYGLASLVGLSRVEQRQHFMSDVVAGGLIGTFVGKAVVSYNQGRRADARSKVTMSFAPMLQPGGYGLSVAMRF